MRFSFLFFVVFYTCLSFGQVEIPEAKYPFHTVFEWPKVGGLLLNSDPEERFRDHNMYLVNPDGEVQWLATFYPKTFQPYRILSGNSNYVYFLDQLEIENNKISYNQVNKSGGVVSTSVNLQPELRKLGFTNPSLFEIINITNTEGALVLYLRSYVKLDRQYENVLLFITHHNARVYGAVLPRTEAFFIKEKVESFFYYAGSDGGTVYFARYIKSGPRNTIHFIPVNRKGEIKSSVSLTLPTFNTLTTKTSIKNWEGAFHNGKDYYPDYVGVGLFDQGKFFYVENNAEDLALKVWAMNEKGDLDELLKTTSAVESKRKISSSLDLFHDGTHWVIASQIENEIKNVRIEPGKAHVLTPASSDEKLLMNNPSLFSYPSKSTNFVLPINKGVLLFDYAQFGKTIGVQFSKE